MSIRATATATSAEQLLVLSVMPRSVAIERKDASPMLRQLATAYELGAIARKMQGSGA